MKRSELAVGAELYHAKPSDWNYSRTPNDVRVRVLSVEPHALQTYGPYKVLSGKGNGVLVEILNAKTGEPNRWRWGTSYVVQLAHLRGPYEATKAHVEAQQAAVREAREQRKSRQETVAAAVTAVMDRGRLVGISSVTSDTSWDVGDIEYARVSLSLTDFERLVDAYERRTT